jgi:hypothetical protein
VSCMIVFEANGIGQGSRKRLRTALPCMTASSRYVDGISSICSHVLLTKTRKGSVGFLKERLQ